MPDPAADHECSELKRRLEDIELKHQRIREFLDANEQDGVVLGRADSVAWFTSGGDLGKDLTAEYSSVLLFINRTSRAASPTTSRAAGFSRKSWPGWVFSSRSVPGSTNHSGRSPSSATTSGSRLTWDRPVACSSGVRVIRCVAYGSD